MAMSFSRGEPNALWGISKLGGLSPFNDIATVWLPCLCLHRMEEGAYFLP